MFLNINTYSSTRTAALDDSGAKITYGGLCEFARDMQSHVPSRSLIFILSENTIGSLCGYVGALSCRIVPLMLSAQIEKQLFYDLYAEYKPEYLWLPQSSTIAEELEVVWSTYSFKLVKTSFGKRPLHEDLSLLLPTSGSTGSPKLVRHSYNNIEANAHNVASLYGFTQHERPLVTLPMHYTMGLSVISSHLAVGATLLLVKRNLLDPAFWTFVNEQCATSFTGVPFGFEVLRRIRFFRMTLPHLTLITQGGGKMSDELFKTCAEYAHNTKKRFIATYGQTEGTARMAYLPAKLALTKIGSIGMAIPGGQISVIDEHGKEIKTVIAEGEMVYRGPNVTLGYAQSIDDLAKGDENRGVLYTGDRVRRDADGCLYITGRIGRFLKLFGFRVGLDECEQLINNHFKVECACTGTDNSMIIYVTKADYNTNIPTYLSQKTGIIPTAFKVVNIDVIPKNETGKITYSKLSVE